MGTLFLKIIMLIPKKTKFKKQQKGKNFRKVKPALGIHKLHFGSVWHEVFYFITVKFGNDSYYVIILP